MIRELQVIFGVDPIPLHLRVASESLVFLEQLGGVAARAIVDAVAVILTARITLRALLLPATAATAAGLTIIDQFLCVLSFVTNPVVLQKCGCMLLGSSSPIIGDTCLPRSPDGSDCMTKEAGNSPFSTGYDENACPCSAQ
jgi:hypothetical protein